MLSECVRSSEYLYGQGRNRNSKAKRTETTLWKHNIDDIFSLWTSNREEVIQFIEQANNNHSTLKFTTEICKTETAFLDTSVNKGERLKNDSVPDVRTHFKPTETFQYTGTL